MRNEDKNFLYEKNLFVIKSNKKAPLSDGDNEYAVQDRAYSYITNFTGAIDIGARFGGWARNMQKKFQKLYCFEPREKWLYLLEKNIKLDNVVIYPYGIGESEHYCNMQGNRIIEKSVEKTSMIVKTLDSFNFKDISFIKIDTDGYELNVLQGGVKTLLENKPIVCMEYVPRLPYDGEKAYRYILDLGFKELETIGLNKIYSY